MEDKITNSYKYLATVDGEERKVRFIHLPEWDRTVAMADVKVDDLNYAVNEMLGKYGDTQHLPGRLVIPVGIAKKHPKDLYSKKLGRQTSFTNVKPDYAWIHACNITRDGMQYVIQYDGFFLFLVAKPNDLLAKLQMGHGIA